MVVTNELLMRRSSLIRDLSIISGSWLYEPAKIRLVNDSLFEEWSQTRAGCAVRGSEMIQRIKTYYNNMTGFNMRQNEQKYTFFYFVHINT